MKNFIKLNYYEGDEIYVNLDNVTHFVPSEKRLYMTATNQVVVPSLHGAWEKNQEILVINLDDASTKKLQTHLNKTI